MRGILKMPSEKLKGLTQKRLWIVTDEETKKDIFLHVSALKIQIKSFKRGTKN